MLGDIHSAYTYRLKPHIKRLRGADLLGRKLAQLADRELPATQGTPTPVTGLEWDHLIILDACRLDTFQDVVGDCGTRTTVGSHSREYVARTFSTGELQDTVYVTPNPHLTEEIFQETTGRDRDEVFHAVDTLMDLDEEKASHPRTVSRRARRWADDAPDKRLIVHYMQPHEPFLQDPGVSHETAYRSGDSSAVQEAYRHNLELVWEHARELGRDLPGRTLITADHGELLGEAGMYGHPPGMQARLLRDVPLKHHEGELEGIDI